MAIYLTGGGDQENFKKLDQHFLKKLPDNANILVVPQASDNYHDALERVQEEFTSKKISNIELLNHPNKMTWSELEKYDAMIIEGGNTFQLIRAIRESSFFQLIKMFQNHKKIIYADSAGAILLGNSVQTAFLGDDGDEDHQKLQDYRGLDILNHWSIHAHYETEEKEQLNEFLYDHATPIICLNEAAGVFIENNDLVSLGSESAHLLTFSGDITALQNEEIDLSQYT